MHAGGAADIEHACAESCLRAEKSTRIRRDTLQNGTWVTRGRRIGD